MCVRSHLGWGRIADGARAESCGDCRQTAKGGRREEDTGKGTEERRGDTCVSFSTVNSGREVMRTVVLWNDGHQ